MAADLSELAAAMGFERYATLGHSYGAFVVLQHAVDRRASRRRRSSPAALPSARYLSAVEDNLAAFEPVELREQVTESWAREAEAQTQEDCAALLHDQLPFHFADPLDPRIEEFERRTAGGVYAPDVLRHFAVADYGAIEVEDRLGAVSHPVLVLAGRHDRTCVVEGGEAIAAGIPGAQLAVFEASGAPDVRRGERGVPERRAALPSVGAVEAVAGVAEPGADVAPLVELAVDRGAEDRHVGVVGAHAPRAPRGRRRGRRSAAASRRAP